MASDTLELSNGVNIPLLGLGTYKSTEFDCITATKNAVEAGYRHIDTAMFYRNEEEIGRAVAELEKGGVVDRSELFITSKLWNSDHQKSKVRPALEKTLERLGTKYLDLYLIHWPIAWELAENAPVDTLSDVKHIKHDFTETWKEMENCVKLGLTKSIGLSNFNKEQIMRILKVAEIKPVVNQVEAHVYFNQKNLVEFCSSKGIHVTAYRPLGTPGSSSPLSDPQVEAIAKKYNKTNAQILLKFLVQRGLSAIPKSVTKERIKNNIHIFDFTLSADDMKTLYGLDQGPKGRGVDVKMWESDPEFPFAAEF